MLSSLRINDLAIIEDAKIEYDNGLNIMTGETGSGKSIIIDSINAIRGERSSRELISANADCAKVTAVFDNVNEKVVALLKDYDIDCSDGSLIIQRIIKENRNICKINGENVTVSVLRLIGDHLVNIHGQNDNQTLLNEDNHIGYIDKIASNGVLLSEYKEKFRQLKEINKRLKKLTMDENEKERRLEALAYQISEIEGADIKIGEKAELTARKNKQLNTEKIKSAFSNADGLLNGSEDKNGITSLLYELKNALTSVSDCYEEISEQLSAVDNCISMMQDTSSFVINELSAFDDGISDINAIEERLDLIYRLSRKYGNTEADILMYLESIKQEYEDISLNEEKVGKLTDEYNSVLEELLVISDRLTQTRIDAGKAFSEKIMRELAFLDMPDVKFEVRVSQGRITANGKDEVKFLISANAGQELRPMAKIASGGELSRIMLAIKCVLTDLDDVDTLIFDEIDSGVSGRAAEKIGYKLREVSGYSQVICVTHLAQIAAFATNHLFIEKSTSDNVTRTTVRQLDFEARKAEIARIMGGSVITEATLLSAEEMLRRAEK
ncbi:MAG: DNA repair protein RecN [Ruminococcaceae bacterium]|nr:DNA repair protein RecN [Oscillospiraceae bacterium]